MTASMVAIDAKGLVLGRVSCLIANKLRGKDKVDFSPHKNCGEKVIIFNAKHIHMTGKKKTDKIFYWHTGYPGGIKQKTMAERTPSHIIRKSVERMMPKGPLFRQILKNLRIYDDDNHPFQSAPLWDVGALNPKNKIRREA